MQNEHESYFIGIDDPVEIHKILLESNKQLLITLQRFEKFKEFRVKKVEYLAKLKEIVADTRILNDKLTKLLPQLPVRISPEHHNNSTSTQSSDFSSHHDLYNLDKELSIIEEKLSQIK